jgi:hypothetical protein
MTLVFVAYMISVYVVTYLLPHNILEISPMLNEVVEILSYIIPSIERIGHRSHVPQVAQTILVYELCWMPVLGYVGIRCISLDINIRKTKQHPVRFHIITPLVIVILIWGLFFFFPGSPGGEAWSSRIERSMLTTRYGMAGWTGFIFGGGGASLILIIYIYTKILPRIKTDTHKA